ncbi:MAG: hypothetical protein JL56_16630 [Desulfotomaculum sp. BICA1-6]|nr:MAG: hypothetical protein JL56_16630 [Desulfotomaculum sp. BICA1-6]
MSSYWTYKRFKKFKRFLCVFLIITMLSPSLIGFLGPQQAASADQSTSGEVYAPNGPVPEDNPTVVADVYDSNNADPDTEPQLVNKLAFEALEVASETPITFSTWELANNGTVFSGNVSYFEINAYFAADQAITVIDYTYSNDGFNWYPLVPAFDDGINQGGDGTWGRYVEADFDGWPDGTYGLRAAATDVEGNILVEETQIIKDTTAPNLTGLSVVPNANNNALVLTWTNPVDDFDYAVVYKYQTYGDGDEGGYWRLMEDTQENTYTDTNVAPNTIYNYQVVAVDPLGNESASPPQAEGTLAASPIYLLDWYIGDDGVANSWYYQNCTIEASFTAAEGINSINYELSTDGSSWQELDAALINSDYGLEYNSWNDSWYRYVRLDLSNLADGQYWVRATAADAAENTLMVTHTLIKDIVAEDATDLTATPNAANNALVLTWNNPDDFDYADLYWYDYSRGYWRWLADVQDNTYTDTTVDPDNPYRIYSYQVVVYDIYNNESQNPPEVSGQLHTEGPIGFSEWYIYNEGKIWAGNVNGFNINASFLASRQITAIDYYYSIEDGGWNSLTPFISYDQGLNYNVSTATGYRSITLSIGGSVGLPDGEIRLRAVATDEDGNTLAEEITVYKDTTLPANVADFTVTPNDDHTGLVLSWVNPGDDYDHVIIERSFSTLTNNLIDTTYTDLTAQAGLPYKYRVIAVDAFGNKAANPPDVTAVLPTPGPVLDSMYPNNDFLTNAKTINYDARFRCEQEVVSILLEVSEDGTTWQPLNAGQTTPTMYNEYYRMSGTWDISAIGEVACQLRVTATDAGGRSASDTRTIYVDHVAPAAPADFIATAIQATSPYSVSLSWSSMEDVNYYYLRRDYANPDEGGYSNWYIYPPNHSYTDTYYLKADTRYIYSLQAQDKAGNRGEAVKLAVDITSGPALSLDGGLDIYTNNESYTLVGHTEPGATVTVNTEPVTVDTNGSFSYSATLVEGKNTFTVAAAKDSLSHSQRQRVTLDTQVPTVSSASPSENTVISGTSRHASFSASDIGTGIVRRVLQVSRDDGVSWSDVYDFTTEPSYFYWDTTAPVGEEGPLADGPYKFRALVWDKAGNVSNGTPVRVWIVDNTPPAPPRNLVAAASTEQDGAGQITLTWLANTEPDLDSYSPYRVYRATTPGTGYTYIGSTKETSYQDNGVVAGVTYYYVVTARDTLSNEGDFSTEASAQPLGDTTPPVFTSLPVDGQKVGGPTVSWQPRATDNSPQGVAGFTIEYSADDGASWTSKTLGATAYTYNGVTYYYYCNFALPTAGLVSGDYLFRFTAADHTGNITAVTRNIPLDVDASLPQNVSATPGEGSVILSWDPVPDDDFYFYEVHRASYITGSYYRTGSTIYTRENTTLTDSNLQLGKTYYYKVIHRDASGNFAESNIVAGTPTDDLTLPVVTSITPASGTTVGGPIINFSVTATDNKAVTKMNGFYSLDDGITWTAMPGTKYPTNMGSYYYANFDWYTSTVTGDEVKVKVEARDAAGNMDSMEMAWMLDLSVSAVTNLRTTSGDGSILLEWDAVTDPDLYYQPYRILRGTQSGGPYGDVIAGGAYTSATQYTNIGLTPGTDYYYVIESRDNLGNRARSQEVAGTTAVDDIPPFITSVDPATGLTIGGAWERWLSVYFQDNSGPAGSSASIDYSIDGTTWSPVNEFISGPNKTLDGRDYFSGAWNLEQLASGIYTVRYSVYDGAGNGALETVTYHVDRTPPGGPQNLIAIYGAGSIGLAWLAPPEADVKYYQLYRANALAGPYSKLIEIEGRDNIIYTDTTVQSGLTYYYKVCAVDNFNQEGTASNVAAAAAQSDTSPPLVMGIEPEDGTVLGPLAEITVRAEDNLALSSITLEYSTDDGVSWNEITTIATRDMAVFQWDTTPLNGRVQVRAIARDSANNVSDGSVVRSYIVDTTGPAVTGLVGTAYVTEVLLQWDDVPDEDFYYFLVERKDSLHGEYRVVKKVYSVLGTNDTGLEPGLDYWYRVAAYDRLGNRGIAADEICLTTGGDTTPPWFGVPPQHSQYNYGDVLKLVQVVHDNVGVKTIKFEYSPDGITWTEITTKNYDYPLKTVQFNHDWDVSTLPEGSYQVRAVATDGAGNVSSPSNPLAYIVDRTAPSVPTGLGAAPTSGYVELTWAANAEPDVVLYRVYRSDALAGSYTRLGEVKSYLGYRDRNVDSEATYFYQLTAVDLAGNEGEAAGPVSASLVPDTIVPEILSMIPQAGKTLGGKPEISVLAQDDCSLSRVTLEYRAEGAGDGDWSLIGTRNVDSDYWAVARVAWDTSGLTDGNYVVRATAYDLAGNASAPIAAAYTLNVEPPAVTVVSAVPGGWQADLSWSAVDDADLAGFRLYRSTVLGGPYKLLKTTAGTSFNDAPLVPGQRYYYLVEAFDYYGNSSRSTVVSAVPTADDPYAPTAEVGDDQVVTVGMEAFFDGTLAQDNDRIAAYYWDFGDGTTAITAQPAKAYEIAGTYTVTLTVWDPAGNSASDTIQVKVVPPELVGTLEVRVVDDVSGATIPGASVVIQYPDGATQKCTTNKQGLAYVVAPPGDYKVYAYITDFRPAAIDASMVRNQRSTATVRLKRGPLVVGELNVKRMNLDEIVAAGIDVNAPENQNVFKFELHLGFNPPQELMVNGLGAPLGVGGGGGGGGFEPFMIGESGAEQVQVQPIIIPHPNRPEVAPAIAYLVIPGEARWLKEFFEVGLILENAADPQFVIEDSVASLNLPDGLALAPTREPQHVQVDLGNLAGGEKREVKWIIRGDKKGEYNLAAEFEGVLQPFGDPVKTIFRTKEPFRVWGEDALQMHVITQDRTDNGHPYNLRLGMENVSDAPVYNLSLKLFDEGKQNYIYAPNQELEKSIRELLPGETLWKDYQLISSIEGELALESSYVLMTGGNAEVQSDITAVTVPENAKGTAPVLNQENRGDGTVSLTWDPVEGALGYRIYYVRDDLSISMAPELVYEGAPAVNEVVLDELDGPRDYVLNTLFPDGERLRHAITGLSWVDKAGVPVITVDPMQVLVGRDTELLITVNNAGFPVKQGIVDVGSLARGIILDGYGQARVVIRPINSGTITLTAYDQDRQFLVSKTISAVEPSPPAKPVGLRANPGDRMVTLTWFANSEPDLAGYNVYQVVGDTWKKINAQLVVENNYAVHNLNNNTSYVFQVNAINQSGKSSAYSDPVKVTLGSASDTVAPWVISTTPVNNQSGVPVNTMVAVNFSEDVALHVNYDGILIKVDNVPVEYDLAVNGNSLALTLNSEIPHLTRCEVIIPAEAIRDRAWNELKEDFTFKFFSGVAADATPPVVVAVSPTDNAGDVSVNTQINVIFNEDILWGANYLPITLQAGGASLAYAAEVNNNVLTLRPEGNLPPNTSCAVTVPAGVVSDVAGNELERSYTFQFFTGATADEMAPEIAAILPSDHSRDVPTNAEINVYFSERIGQGVSFGEISLGAGEGTIEFSSEVNGNILTLRPTGELPYSTLIEVSIPVGSVRDTSGNELGRAYSFRFSTGLSPDYAAPVVRTAAPAAGAGSAPVNTPLRFAFSETIQPSIDYDGITMQANGQLIDYQPVFTGSELTLAALSDLPHDALCEVNIPAGAVKDIAGNNLDQGYSLTFTTESPQPAGGGAPGGGGGGTVPGGGGAPGAAPGTVPVEPPAQIAPEQGMDLGGVRPSVLFKDLPDRHWAASDILYLYQQRIISGYPDQTFRPDQPVTRGEFAALIARLLQLESVDSVAQFEIHDITSSYWAFDPIAAVYRAGIMSGYEDGSFKPDYDITREEMVGVIMAALYYGQTRPSVATSDGLARFKDREKIPGWARAAVLEAVELGIVQGVSEDTFGAGDVATRSQVAALLVRLLKHRTAAGTTSTTSE